MISNKKNYLVKGTMTLALLENEICYSTHENPINCVICGDLMTGKEFYEDVDCGGIIDYDGCLGEVFINGYRSNLGLCHRGLCQGGFIVDGPTWLDLCNDFNIEVEWCNK